MNLENFDFLFILVINMIITYLVLNLQCFNTKSVYCLSFSFVVVCLMNLEKSLIVLKCQSVTVIAIDPLNMVDSYK